MLRLFDFLPLIRRTDLVLLAIPALFATWCVITASLIARYWSRKPAAP